MGSGADHSQALLITGLGTLDRSYIVVYGWLPLVLGRRNLGEATLKTEAGYHLCWAWVPFVGIMMGAAASCLLCWTNCWLVVGTFQAHTGFNLANARQRHLMEVTMHIETGTTCAGLGDTQ